MAVTLILPNGAEVHSGATPYCMTDAEARAAREKGAGPATTAAAEAAAEALAAQLVGNATPETLAKVLGVSAPAEADADERLRLLVDAARQAEGRALTRDPLVLMHRRGGLPTESLRAGQEIARVFKAIEAGVTPRVVASYGERSAAGPAMEDWPASLRSAYRDRYVPWREWAGRLPVRKRGSRETVADLTLLVAGEGYGLDCAALALRTDARLLREALRESLWWYALHAGWASDLPAVAMA